MNRGVAVGLALVILSFRTTNAAAPVFRFEHLSTRNGLSHNSVIEIIQDHQGFMWFGTLNGLNRYDGYRFSAYRPVPGDTTSLCHNVINALFEDSRGTVWIGTLDGLNCYDRVRDCFIRFYHDPGNTNSLVDNRIRCVMEDHLGQIWIGTEGGLSCYNPQANTFQNFFPIANDPTSLGDFIIHDIYEDSRQQLWIATEKGGVNRFNRNTQSFTRYRHEAINPSRSGISAVITLCEDQWGKLWIGTWGDGLQRIADNSQRFKRVSLVSGGAEPIAPEIITKLLIDQSERLWIGTYNTGLFIMPRVPEFPNPQGTGGIQHYLFNPLDETSIQSNTLWTIYLDRTGVVWLGNENGGINKCDTKQSNIQHFRSGISGTSSLSNNHVTSFYEDEYGLIWIGTRFGGLNRFDPGRNHFQIFRKIAGRNNSLGSDAIISLAGDREFLWIGTDGDGLDRFNIKTGRFDHFKHDDNNPASIGEDAIYCLYLDKSNTLWIGTWGGGLSRLNSDGRTFKNYAVDQINERLNVVTSIAENKSGALWLGTYGKGLVYFDPRNEEMLYFRNSETDSLSLGHDNINTLFVSRNETLWIGTMGAGLNYLKKFQPDSGIACFGRYDQKNGLPDNIIESVVEDDDGFLWMGTNHGIARLNPATGEIRNFDRNDGFGQDIFYHESVLLAGNGMLCFGGIEGFNLFQPGHIGSNPYVPEVVITQFQIFNETVGPNTGRKKRLDRSIFIADHLKLSYKENVFSFEFAALDFSCPQKNQYAYLMEGFDLEWRRTDADRRFATYTNLPPGDYTFRVIASNNHGLWNETGTAINLTITPPFWRTNWMLSIYISLILGAILLIRMAVQIRERNLAQTELRRLEAKKIHDMDQLKLQFFTHISHEFRTPLTLIIGPVERMLELGSKMNSKKRNVYNRIVLQNARRLLRLVNQLMDARKLDTGSMKLELQWKEFITFIKAIYSVFRLQAEQKKVRYTFSSDVEQLWLFFDPDKIEKAVYNVIANALKFTEPGGQVNVTLNYRPDKQDEDAGISDGASRSISIQISDTGIGIAPDQIEHIFDPFYQVRQPGVRKMAGTGIGLSISKDFIEMHDGHILVESTPGQGSTFSLIIPVKSLPENGAKPERDVVEPETAPQIAEMTPDESLTDEQWAVSESEHPESEKSQPLILAVEDDKDLRQYLTMEIENQYSVIQAADGLSGYELAVDRIPDLIICDVKMQVMDGIEFCHRCKNDQRTSHIPIILLTAQISEERRKEGLLAGADDYITKPFNPEMLKVRMENLLNIRRKMRDSFSHKVFLNPQDIQISSPDEQFMQKIIEVVEQYLSDPGFSVDDLSYHVGLSRAQLYRKMQGLINQTPSDFIRTYRLQRARQLLDKGHSPAQVCYQIGFRDPSYFTKCFRKQFGQTPQQIHRKSESGSKN